MNTLEGKHLFWEQDVDGMVAQCHWESGNYTVTVSKGDIKKTEKFPQTFTPTFGMDVADVQTLMETAEKLAVEIENQEKNAEKK